MASPGTAVRFVEGDARRFGEFELIAKLGRGGMADVFLAARTERPAELLVVKRLVADFREDDEHRGLFAEEARVMGMLHHPNIVRTIESHADEGPLYLAMEFLDGLPLDRCASVVTELGERAALHVASELLDGLHYAHELRGPDGEGLELVHRDVSPHNVFLTYEGRVTLVDFGIAKSKGRSQHTATGVVRGKLTYMAPEQALCEEVDRRADVFAVGVVLWELLSGKRFWDAHSDVQILKKMTFGELPPLDRAPIRPELAEVLAQALAVRPEDRFPTARAFRDELVKLFDGPFKRADLGQRVEVAAGDYRAALKNAIDAHLTEARDTAGLPGIDGALPLIEAPPPPPSLRGAPALGDPREAPVSGPRPDLASPAFGESTAGPASDDDAPDPLTQTGGTSAVTVVTQGRRGRRAGLGVVFGIAAIAAAAVITTRFVGSSPATANSGLAPATLAPAPAPTATPTATVTSDAAPPGTDVVSVSIDVAPRDAIVTLDGKRITELPFSARFKKDGMGHELSAVLGKRKESRILVFDRDVDVTVALPEPTSGGSARVAPTARSGSAPTPTVVDDRDPWAKPQKKH